MLNPYATFLGDRDPQEVLSSTAARLAEFYKQLGPTGLEKSPAPGKWSPREIFAHLADCEIAFAFRLRQTLAEDNHVIQPFDQEHWARTYASYDASAAVATFSAVRRWNLSLIHGLSDDDRGKTVNHPERGPMTFATIVETMAGHDLNHLQQLEKIQQA
ncbi:DinB family protein [Acidobacterium sp. S8]|uniref:DinB family protein n=1 Tax=Acidobacterium sp. S8 TaxID=1641854 RepID=UPI0020B12800|nr:DinB family protein [Acidobacterium sp. S8]